ncbi:hypothetical protein [Vibrio casei]|uniref:hypothetical protein n=1 Tax=Vibrio casei TaxID=673372 RepID=UPI000B5C1DE8|nr:hypothetical protein [Vibrio casei]
MTLTQQLEQEYPHFKHHLKKIRDVYANIKSRCSKHPNYLNVKCEFENIFEVMDFLEYEKSQGRDYTKIDKPQIARLFDEGNYSAKNCRLLSKSENLREAHNKPIQIYDSLNNKTTVFNHGVINFYNINKSVFNFTLSTMYRKIHANKPIMIGDHFIKVSFL